MTRGERAIAFIEALKVPKGRLGGQSFALLPWQKEFIVGLLDNVDDDGLRVYRSAALWIPKKNGKSTLIAALAVFFLYCENEIGLDIICAANTKEQASLVFNAAAAIIRADKYLSSLVKIVDSQKIIRLPSRNATFKAISAEDSDKNGLDSAIVIYDEIAEAKTDELYNKLETGTAARQQPLVITMSTAGEAANKSAIGYRLYEYACKVRDGSVVDPRFYGVIYEAPEGADHSDPAVWQAANPSWGIILNEAYMRKAIDDAANMPSKVNDIRRYHLNIWADRTVQWIPSAKWKACEGVIDAESLKGKRCWIGADLAATTDLAAVVALFYEDGKWLVLPWFFVPTDSARQRAKVDKVLYPLWIEQGFVVGTDSKGITDYDAIRAHIEKLATLYDVQSIAMDRWDVQTIRKLRDAGLTVDEWGQGWLSMTAPCKELEKSIIAGRIVHDGNPCMSWNVANAIVLTDAAENMKPDKSRASDRMDGVTALLNAIGVALKQGIDTEPRESVYESRGVLFL